MKPITSIKVAIKKGDPITIRLGDLFTIDSELKVINSDTTHHYTALMLLTTAITLDLARVSHSKIYFTMIGTDKMSYTITRTTENSIVLVNPNGKESEVHKKYLIKAMRRFELADTSIVAEGVRLYVCTAISRLADLRDANIRKMETRAMDLSKWPCSSLVIWARHHLGIPSPHVPKAKYMDDKVNAINGMLKISATRNASVPKPTKDILAESSSDQTCNLFMRGAAGDSRFGSINGVKFINLSRGELSSRGEANLPMVYAERDITIDHLSMYMVVCLDNAPMWVIVSPSDGHDIPVEWRLYETTQLLTYARKFTRVNVHWLVDRLRSAAYKKKAALEDLPIRTQHYEPGAVTTGRLNPPRPSSRFYSPNVPVDAPEPPEPRRVETDMGRTELNTFKWSTSQAAEALSNNSRSWEDEEDEVIDDLLEGPDLSEDEDF